MPGMFNRLGTAAFALVLLSSIGCKPKAQPDPSTTDAATTAATADKPAGVVFTKKAPAVGDKRDEDETMDLSMALSIDLGNGKPMNQDVKEHDEKKRVVEVLAATGDAVTKVKVIYGTVDKKTTEGGKDKTKPSPTSGKTYIVDSAGGKTTVTDANGKASPVIEAKEVEKDFKSLGKPDPMTAAIPSTPLKPGDKVDAMSTALTEFLNRDMKESEGVKVSNVNVTFKEQSGDEGIFDLALTVTKEDGPMGLAIDLKGTAHMLVKGSTPTKLEMKGPIKIVAKEDPKAPKMKIEGSGTMSMLMTAK